MTIRDSCDYDDLNRDNDLSCTDEEPCELCKVKKLSPEETDERAS